MSKSRAKGTAMETAVVKFCQENGFPYAERRALAGSLDKGDITGIPGVMIEVKNCAKITLAQWADEVEVQTKNAGADIGVLWIKRRGKNVAGSYVMMDPATFIKLTKDRD